LVLRASSLDRPFGRLGHIICETLKSATALSLGLSLGVEATNAIQEAFKFTQPGSVLLLVTWLLYIVHEAICLPLLIVAQLLLLLLFVVEGRFLSQDVFVGDSQHFF
jgi:hypothetical protein